MFITSKPFAELLLDLLLTEPTVQSFSVRDLSLILHASPIMIILSVMGGLRMGCSLYLDRVRLLWNFADIGSNVTAVQCRGNSKTSTGLVSGRRGLFSAP